MASDDYRRIQVSPKQRGGKTISRRQFWQEMSEQSRISFYAEGIRVERDDWNRVFEQARKRRTRLATIKGSRQSSQRPRSTKRRST